MLSAWKVLSMEYRVVVALSVFKQTLLLVMTLRCLKGNVFEMAILSDLKISAYTIGIKSIYICRFIVICSKSEMSILNRRITISVFLIGRKNVICFSVCYLPCNYSFSIKFCKRKYMLYHDLFHNNITIFIAVTISPYLFQ